MTPADLLAQHRAMLAEIGEDIAVRRHGGTGAARGVLQEAIACGRVVRLGADDIIGDIKLSDRKVILVNDPDAPVAAGKVALSSLLPLRTSDTPAFRETEAAILSADDDTRRINGVLIAIEIVIRG